MEERDVLDLMAQYIAERNAATGATRAKDATGKAIKAYLEEHPDDELHDGEHRIRAWLSNTTVSTCDVRPLSADQVLYLHSLGLLDMKSALFKQMRIDNPSTQLDDIAHTRGVFTEGGRPVLHVEQEDR